MTLLNLYLHKYDQADDANHQYLGAEKTPSEYAVDILRLFFLLSFAVFIFLLFRHTDTPFVLMSNRDNAPHCLNTILFY